LPNEKEPQELNTDLAASEEADAPPPRPVRMKWGRPVYDPEEAPPVEPPKPQEPLPQAPDPVKPVAVEPPPQPEKPRPDPRMEALKRRLAQMEKARMEEERLQKEQERKQAEEREARRLAEEAERKNAPQKQEKHGKQPTEQAHPKHPPRRLPSPEEIRRAQEEDARQEAMRRRDDEAMREELEHARLQKAIRKKRRREAASHAVRAFFFGILAFLRLLIPSKKTVLALSVTACGALLLAIVLGNLLKSRVDPNGMGDVTEPPTGTEAETVPYDRGLKTPAQNAGIVSLTDATEQTLRREARRFREAGMTAVSLLLCDSDGTLLFDSSVNAALGIFPENATLSISRILASFHDEGLYVSCIFSMRFFLSADAHSERILYAYETELLSEVAQAGADEIVLLDADRLFRLTDESGARCYSDKEALSALTEIAVTVHGDAPETAVGLTCSPDFLASVQADLYLSALAKAFDFTLLDLRAFQTGAPEEDRILSDTVSAHLYFVLRYGMRILIPEGAASAVSDAGIHNWQEGTLPKNSGESLPSA
jgi:hypothetical protein